MPTQWTSHDGPPQDGTGPPAPDGGAPPRPVPLSRPHLRLLLLSVLLGVPIALAAFFLAVGSALALRAVRRSADRRTTAAVATAGSTAAISPILGGPLPAAGGAGEAEETRGAREARETEGGGR
ncbi:hypothetical protein [Streptomyces sp. NPDC049915]|uniref:hypothetical protein n=1 Tax=Streptomyces sp. NPDC049915 TaxID=3155510 RepID=UPI0034178FD4